MLFFLDEREFGLTGTMVVQKYKAVTTLFESHLSCLSHPLAYIKSLYEEYFTEKYTPLTRFERSDLAIESFEYEYFLMINDLKEFLTVFKDSLYYFYCLSKVIKNKVDLQSVFSRENFVNFLLGVLISDRVYSLIFSVRRILDLSKEQKFSNYIARRWDSSIQSFSISPRFTLDDSTIAFGNEHTEACPFSK